jgi:uncharacterized protein (DUF2147 family)
MKQLIILLTIPFSLNCYCQNYADAIIGKWIKIPKEDLIIEVYKTENEYKGKINWTKDNERKKLVGSVILEKLKYNSKSKRWEKGRVHNPESGNRHKATAKIKADGILEVTGYAGMKFLRKKKYFKKVR